MTKARNMRKTWDRIRTVPGLGGNLLWVIVLITVGVASGGYILSNYAFSWPWQERFVFAAKFEKAPGLQVSSSQEVRIAGVAVGEVTAATPEEDGTARLVMTLEPGHPVYQNARLELRTKTPLNAPYIALDPGSPPAGQFRENDTIPVSQTRRYVQPFEVLNKLDERTQAAVTSLLDQSGIALADAPAQLPAGLRATTDTLNTFRPVVEALQTRRQKIEQLVTSLSRIATAAGDDDQRLARLVSSLQETLAVLSDRDGELGTTLDQLPGLTGDLRTAMTATSALTTQLNPTLEELNRASDELPAALTRLTDTVEQAGPVLAAAKPVVQKARPVMADLRPFVADADAALDDLRPVTADLPNATAQIAPWMPNLAAFVYQTSSAFSLQDANGGFGRAQLFVDASNPTGGLQRERVPAEPAQGGN